MSVSEIPASNEETISELLGLTVPISEIIGNDPPLITAVSHPNPTTAYLLTSKAPIHQPEAGINLLVDEASYLFSLLGKLKHVKSYKNLNSLHQELVQEIENFKENLNTYEKDVPYLAEYLPLSIYALCTTIDDIILTTPWGNQDWQKYSLVKIFYQEPISAENFLILLERLVMDPNIYIDVIEFFYICLSLGFKGGSTEFTHEQLEHITHSLYKRIRLHRGNFSKTLSPFAIRRKLATNSKKVKPTWFILLALSSLIAAFIAGKYLFDTSTSSRINGNHHTQPMSFT